MERALLSAQWPPPLLNEITNPVAFLRFDTCTQVEILQTHSSAVLLTPRFAFKIKKPVNLGFLNYSSLGARMRACAAELSLNRRLCPQVYLDVQPICIRKGELTIGGDGEPIEYALRMNRLDGCRMLDRMAADHTVTLPEMQTLVDRMAIFHTSAPRGRYAHHFGDPKLIRQTIDRALSLMARVGESAISPPQIARIRTGMDGRFIDSRILLAARSAAGLTRECHGDLRVQNVCFDPRYDGGVQLFDCLEFSQRLRFIDLAADIAYLDMDFELVGRSDLQAQLVELCSHYSVYDGYRAIAPMYRLYRSIVRGNIAILASIAMKHLPDEKMRQLQVAKAAYDLALSYV